MSISKSITCSKEKPVCLKHDRKLKIRCSSAEIDPLAEINHAYTKYEGEEPDECPQDEQPCYCTYTDYVWIINIKESIRRLEKVIEQLQGGSPPINTEELKKFDVKTVTDNIFDANAFIKGIIDIAKRKWSVTLKDEGSNSKKIIDELTRLLELIPKKEELDAIKSEVTTELNKTIQNIKPDEIPTDNKLPIAILKIFIGLFDVGYAVGLLEENQLGNSETDTILGNLKNTYEFFIALGTEAEKAVEPEKTSGGRKSKKSKKSKKKSKKSKKKNGSKKKNRIKKKSKKRLYRKRGGGAMFKFLTVTAKILLLVSLKLIQVATMPLLIMEMIPLVGGLLAAIPQVASSLADLLYVNMFKKNSEEKVEESVRFYVEFDGYTTWNNGENFHVFGHDIENNMPFGLTQKRSDLPTVKIYRDNINKQEYNKEYIVLMLEDISDVKHVHWLESYWYNGNVYEKYHKPYKKLYPYEPPNPPAGSGIHHYKIYLYNASDLTDLSGKLEGETGGQYYARVLEPSIKGKEPLTEPLQFKINTDTPPNT
jgi:hypothetical protein